jgi:hypothetical protein
MGTFNFTNRSHRLLKAATTIALSTGFLAAIGCNEPLLRSDAFVTIVAGGLQLATGSVTQIAVSSTPSGVTWSITGGTGCPTSGCGTLTGATATTVSYAAPATLPGSTMTVTIEATSTTDSKQTASQTFTIYSESVQITGPSGTTITPLTSAAFSATVPGDRANQGVTWSLSGNLCAGEGNDPSDCGSFTGRGVSQATFNAPPAPQLEMVTITATANDAPNETASITVTVPKLAIFVFTPTVLPAAIVGQPYDAKIGIEGNTEPYTVSISSPLPPGLSAIVSGYGTTCDPTNASTLCQGNTIEFTTATQNGKGAMPAVYPITLYPTVSVTDSSIPALTAGQPLTIPVYPSPATGNNLLKGSYAFYGIGFHDGSTAAVSQNPIYYIGSFTADGKGNITGGELDVNDSQSVTGITSYSSLGGTYNLQYGNDGNGNPLPGYQTGYIVLVPPGKPPRPITMAVALNAIQYASGASATSPSANDVATAGHFIQFDDTTGITVNLSGYSTGIRVSGSLAQQSPSVLSSAASPFTGSYAYGLNGFSAVQDFPLSQASSKNLLCSGAAACGPISVAGSMAFGANGAISSGLEDVLVAENHTQVGVSGSVSNSGDPDANGRVAANIALAASATQGSTSTMPDWPTDYAFYAISPTQFYYMSIDSNLTNSMLAGEADQQNLAHIASTPFSGHPMLMYVNENGAGNYNDSGTNGQDRVLGEFVTPAPSSATAGSMGGQQWANLSGTYTSNSGNPGTTSPATWPYTVSPSTGLVEVTTQTEPCMYLIDTDKGWGTQCLKSQTGLWYIQPQTSTTLNPGWYAYSVYSQIEPVSPLEVGAFYVAGGIGAAGTPVTINTGTDYTEFENQAGAYVQVTSSNTYAEPMEYTGAITSGTFQETNGIFYELTSKSGAILTPNGIEIFGAGSNGTQSTFQGCGQNSLAGSGGFVISSTSFMCTPSGGSFGGIHVFQQ